ncbi:hypothetical protein DFS34DRAFT_501005 [Phlyctochytrium arcticum]|nr:hypothetical protein DFS34DRAFT_501005 [Phlyctochytrium arcticum]
MGMDLKLSRRPFDLKQSQCKGSFYDSLSRSTFLERPLVAGISRILRSRIIQRRLILHRTRRFQQSLEQPYIQPHYIRCLADEQRKGSTLTIVVVPSVGFVSRTPIQTSKDTFKDISLTLSKFPCSPTQNNKHGHGLNWHHHHDRLQHEWSSQLLLQPNIDPVGPGLPLRNHCQLQQEWNRQLLPHLRTNPGLPLLENLLPLHQMMASYSKDLVGESLMIPPYSIIRPVMDYESP